MATIKEKNSELMKASMKSGDKDTVGFTRNLLAAIRKKEIDDKVDLDDAGVQKIIATALKQRQDSIEQFRAGGREDLATKEEAEAKFLKTYMPAQMDEAEVRKHVEWAVNESKAASPKDMGAVMKLLLPKIQGQADGKFVSTLVNQALAGIAAGAAKPGK